MAEDKTAIDLLPLVPEKHEYDDARKSSYRLLTDPTDTDSVKYHFTMYQIDGSEPLREILTFRRNVTKLARGSDLESDAKAPQLILIVGRMLHGTAETSFQQGVDRNMNVLLENARSTAYHAVIVAAVDPDAPTALELQAATAASTAVAQPDAVLDTLKEGLDAMVQVLAPFRALARVKRYLRRACRKPADMSIRTYVSHFNRINEEELALLPPFSTNNKLDFSEMIEIWQYAIPSSWNRKLQEQGKDPVLMTANEFVTATEFIESSEADYAKVPRKKDSTSSKKKKSAKTENPGGTKYCKYHGKNNTHTTEECKVLKAQKEGKKVSFGKNKTWSRDSDKSTSKSKKDLSAFIAKAVKKELNSFNSKKNKRKADLNAIDANGEGSDNDSDSDISLKDFDYEQFENLSFNGSLDDSEHSTKSFDTAQEE